ncbi:probable beta-D-xylosidase 7 [Cucurbita maxima]|uniref:Probable beta-D-xylosidase 7 n=1 Tax=Cucurbita maxima TaxID=3661 RepID=A0A6J1KCT6_CUCMA|nr:probable beta-D-xylosidase 7 [Cucurbita maxima]
MASSSSFFPPKMKLQQLLLSAAVFFSLLSLIAAESSSQPPYACDSSNSLTNTLPFCRTSLSINLRARDLVSRLTLDEKVLQLVNTAPAIPRLGIPAYEWWSEALHGVAHVGYGIRLNGTIPAATSFPQVILTAASFDANLWYQIGQAIGTEARAVYNAGQAKGMTFWAPNINIFRDPRWGRGQETPGEDPMMSGKYSVAYVRGIQGDSIEGGALGNQLKASACCKHFTAYDLERWEGMTRYVFDAKVTPQDMADTYQPPFESCVVQGKASGIMCAYNRLNGVPTCADHHLLTVTARNQWKFNGYIVSDCDAVSIIHDAQNYAKIPEDAVAAVLAAGMDINCGTYLKNHTKSAVEMNKVHISDIDRALSNLFAIRMRLGLFDGNPTKLPYGQIGPNDVCSKNHQMLALQAAREGIVLLKNDAKLLPLSKWNTHSLAVIGHNADAPIVLRGNYAGIPCNTVTPLQGLNSYVKNTVYHKGCNWANCTEASVYQAVEVAKSVDYVVLVMGLDQTQEREDFDRSELVLPGKQEELIAEVAKAAKRPVILVILSGGPVDISSAKYNAKIGSILWAGYPGQAGGTALAEIIFGDHNPGGRLPVTWYPRDFIKVPMTDMRMRAEPSSGYPGRTYRFYNGPKVYEFGYGLSYSDHHYEFTSVTGSKLNLRPPTASQAAMNSDSVRYRLVSELDGKFCESNAVNVTVGVRNQGGMGGKHSVLLFVKPTKPENGSPMKQLVGFKRVEINAGDRSEVEFLVNPCKHVSKANEEGLMVIEEGSHSLVVGDVEHPLDIFV